MVLRSSAPVRCPAKSSKARLPFHFDVCDPTHSLHSNRMRHAQCCLSVRKRSPTNDCLGSTPRVARGHNGERC
jgi:hypothetical protein